MSESERKTCPQCGKELPHDAPGGLCPSCVMAMNLAAETELTGDTGPMPVSPEEIASRLPLFDILEFLGRGGMGVVYKARQIALDREVAIKVLAGEWQKDVDFAERFEREAKTLAQMSHPNIVTVHDFGDADGLYYIVMEYVDGVNLRDLLSDGKMEPEQALAVVPPICDALEYAHGKGVVHRDIKPENLLLDREGRVKIADFGIASLVGKTKDISGTPSYMAPEQANGSVDRRTDIYALGVVLYEMLTGERPAKDIVAPSKKVEVDVKIDEMVLRALEKEPERRYQTAREFRTTAQMAMTPPHGDAANAGRSRSSCTSTHPAESPWPGRFFWLLASLVGTPAFALLAMLLAPQAARQGIGDFEVVSWLTGAAVLAVAALVPPAMLLNSLLRPRADSEQCDQTTGGSRGAYGAQAPPAAEGPTFSPWESTTALAGTIFSAAMLFPVMALPGPSRLPVMFLFLVAFSIGVVSLAGFWPFPSPFFPEPNFSSRNLPRYGARGDQRPNGEVATLACIAAVGLLLLTATGDALVMLVGASVMLLAGLAFCSRDGFRQSLLVGLAAIGVAAVVVLLALRGNILDVLPQSWGPEREVSLFELESESEGPRFLDLDSGETLSMPDEKHSSDDETRRWMAEEGLDVFAESIDGRWGLITARANELKLARVPAERLADITPADLRELLLRTDPGLEVKDEDGDTGWRGHFLPEPHPVDLALAFHTANGAKGILYVEALASDSQRLKIRYKLVNEAMSPITSGNQSSAER